MKKMSELPIEKCPACESMTRNVRVIVHDWKSEFHELITHCQDCNTHWSGQIHISYLN